MEISINCENILHDKSEAIQYIVANTRHYMYKYPEGMVQQHETVC